MSDVMNYKCPNCGAPLVYKGDKQKMVCESCDSEFTMAEVKAAAEKEAKNIRQTDMTWSQQAPAEIRDESGKLKGYTCPSCGAEIVADENTAATECPYCGNKAIMPKAFDGMYKPDCMIPFKVDKTAAQGALLNFYKGKRLLPDAFVDGNRIKNINGLYVPFWLFDCTARGDAVYTAEKREQWEDANARYVKTDTYRVARRGTMEFEKIPADASKQMDNAFMDAIEPFDYGQLQDYDAAYFSGYMADKYDVTQEESAPRVNERVTNSMKEKLRETVTGYNSVCEERADIGIQEGTVSYAMMPVWMLSTKFNDNIYTFAMNGQTGKVVGSLPVDMGKFYKYLGGISAVMMLLAQLVLYFATETQFSGQNEGIALLVSVVIGLISVMSMKSAMNTAVVETQASRYEKDETFDLATHSDVFVSTRTDRFEKEKPQQANNNG